MIDLLKNSKPILFSTEMVKAILDGRKTQFRKVIKLNDNSLIPTGYIVASTDRKRNGCYSFGKNRECDLEYVKSKYKCGDILYVRETFCIGTYENDDIHNEYWYIGQYSDSKSIFYKASLDGRYSDPDNECIWKPSIHMTKEDARILLKVTNIRVERLQDMSHEDLLAEGFDFNYFDTKKEDEGFFSWWINLWNSTSKDGYKYEDNPYVFVYEFERIK